MNKKLLTLALMFAFLAPIALTLPAAQAAPIENTPGVKAEQKKPKPAPTPRRPGGPQGSDDE